MIYLLNVSVNDVEIVKKQSLRKINSTRTKLSELNGVFCFFYSRANLRHLPYKVFVTSENVNHNVFGILILIIMMVVMIQFV